MKLDVYVNYPGTCEAAFRFYERELGGKITLLTRHEDQPNQANVPANWKQAILHARIELGASVLMGADIPGAEPMRSAYLTLTLDEGGGTRLRAACGRRAGLHEDGADLLRESVRDAARPVWHVVDAAPRGWRRPKAIRPT